jgi:hypothetical protein
LWPPLIKLRRNSTGNKLAIRALPAGEILPALSLGNNLVSIMLEKRAQPPVATKAQRVEACIRNMETLGLTFFNVILYWAPHLRWMSPMH